MPIPYSSRSKAFNSQLRGADIEAEFDRLYADANDLLSKYENALGLNGATASEVLAARKGQPDLLAEIDRLEAIKAEVEAARNSANQGGAFASLDARLEAIDTRITNALSAVQGAAEVVEGRTDSAGKVHAAIKQAINNGSKDLEGLSLAAINRIVVSSANIIDAIIYDPSRDSDGGAWRERCQHLSWFNEPLNTATRGKTAKFPGPVLIVATQSGTSSGDVRIYDATDPALPMWMAFNWGFTNLLRHVPRALAAVNGVLYIGSDDFDLFEIKFPADTARRYQDAAAKSVWTGVGLVERNSKGYASTAADGIGLVNRKVKDVAATVLPGAPIDPATGLPVPTVAVATEGGVSVIRHDGTIVNSSHAANIPALSIYGTMLAYGHLSSVSYSCRAVDLVGISAGFSGRTYSHQNSITTVPAPAKNADKHGYFGPGVISYAGQAEGFSVLKENPTEPTKGMVHYVTKDYFSGILPGDIRRAWLASGTAETISGANVIANGSFNDSSAWGTAGGWNISGGKATHVPGTNFSLNQVALTIGKQYLVTFTVSGRTVGNVYPLAGNGTTGTARSSNGTFSELLTCSGNTSFYLQPSSDFDGSIDDVYVIPVVEDRSVKNKGLGVYGSLVKSSVAVGADLMGYSGFSATNYLEEPYSADLDFGTADFLILGWFKSNNTIDQNLFSRGAYSGAWVGGGTIGMHINGSLKVFAYISDDSMATTDTLESTQAIGDNQWHFVMLVRRGSVLELWIDGVKAAADKTITAAIATLNNASAITRIGYRQSGTMAASATTMALWRAAAFAPSAEQLRMIYEYERQLFVDNAKCLLAGTSNTAQAIDYDPETGILLVGTNNGVSLFQGLRRINHITAAPLTNTNMKAVSGINGAILMGNGAEAVYQAPQRNIREEVERVKRRFVTQQPRTAWFTSAASQVDFDLPTRASRILGVTVAGALAREASGAATNRYQVLDYGYKQTIRLGASPTTGSDVAVQYIEEV